MVSDRDILMMMINDDYDNHKDDDDDDDDDVASSLLFFVVLVEFVDYYLKSLSIRWCVRPSVCPFVAPSLRPFVGASACQNILISRQLFICRPTSLHQSAVLTPQSTSVRPSACLSVHPSISRLTRVISSVSASL